MSSKTTLSAHERLSALFDSHEFTEVNGKVTSGESLCGVVCAFGYIESSPVYAFAQDKSQKDGALTQEGAMKLVKLYKLAAKTGVPIVGVYDSFGADINDTVGALQSYGAWMKAANIVSGVVPVVSLIAGDCGITAAMIAVSADFVVMDKSAQLFVTPNVEDKESAQTALENGTAALVCEDYKEAAEAVRELVSRLPQNNISEVPIFEFSKPSFKGLGDAETAALSVFDKGSVRELYKDFGRSSYTALATLNGASVGVVLTNKTEKKLIAEDAEKIARFVRTCDAYSLPIITLVDTKGFCKCVNDQKRGAVKLWSKVAAAYSEATTIKLSAVIGKAYGAAFMALSGTGSDSDMVIATEKAVISSVDPVTAVEFLWHDKLEGTTDLKKDRAQLVAEYVKENASAEVAAEKMCVDEVVAEKDLRDALISGIEMLAGKRVSSLPKKHSNNQL